VGGWSSDPSVGACGVVGRRLRVLTAVVLALGVGVGVAGCTSDPPTGTATSSSTAGDQAAEAAPSSPAPSPSDDKGDGSTATPAPPLPNTISAAPSKVQRPGQPDKPSVVADQKPFSDAVTYGDKVVLTITKATKQVETGNGPGVFAGREFVKFDIELANGSDKPIDLNSVVVTTFYGASNQLAPPVYTPSAGTADFSGELAAGQKATASYGYAIPTADLGTVTMVVDFDAVHSSATFTGTVKTS
jgi:hypothetical protein